MAALPRREMLALVVFVLSVTGSPVHGSYVVTDLGVIPGGGQSHGAAISSNGVVAGYATNAENHWHIARSNASGVLQDDGTLASGLNARALSINGLGCMAGYGDAAVPINGKLVTVTHAFVTDMGGGPRDLGGLPGYLNSQGRGVNDKGTVVGFSSASFGTCAFVCTDAHGMQAIEPFFGGNYSQANGINNLDQVVGTSQTSYGTMHAFRFDYGHGMVDLGTFLGGSSSYGTAINNNGQVAGYADRHGVYHAFRSTGDHALQDLGTLPGGYESFAYGMNDLGSVVGMATTLNGANHAFLWSSMTGMVDLNSLISSKLGWTLNEANGINNRGQITGTATFGGKTHAFILSPTVPEPDGFVLTLIGVGLLGLWRSILGRKARRDAASARDHGRMN